MKKLLLVGALLLGLSSTVLADTKLSWLMPLPAGTSTPGTSTYATNTAFWKGYNAAHFAFFGSGTFYVIWDDSGTATLTNYNERLQHRDTLDLESWLDISRVNIYSTDTGTCAATYQNDDDPDKR